MENFKFLLIIFYIKSRKIKGLHGFRVAILSLMNTFFILIPPISDAFKSVHFTDQNSDFGDLTTYSPFSFTANTAGVSETNFSCLRLGRVCFVSGMMKPKIAGTPLSLGSLSIKPVNGIFFHISAFDRVGGWGTFGTDGILSCNIATTMIGENCIVNFAYIAAE